MVRFGDAASCAIVIISLFQFQYGAIWRVLPADDAGRVNLFQFQYGAIWRGKLGVEGKENILFQFQYGAIWSC